MSAALDVSVAPPPAPMKGLERLDHLARLGAEALDQAIGRRETDLFEDREPLPLEQYFAVTIRERMSQAAAAWDLEVPMAQLDAVDRALERATSAEACAEKLATRVAILEQLLSDKHLVAESR